MCDPILQFLQVSPEKKRVGCGFHGGFSRTLLKRCPFYFTRRSAAGNSSFQYRKYGVETPSEILLSSLPRNWRCLGSLRVGIKLNVQVPDWLYRHAARTWNSEGL